MNVSNIKARWFGTKVAVDCAGDKDRGTRAQLVRRYGCVWKVSDQCVVCRDLEPPSHMKSRLNQCKRVCPCYSERS